MFEYFYGIIALALLGIIINAIKILREYQRGVIFQLGRFWKVKGPGLIIVIPVIQRWYGWICVSS
jgi:regulator of protease activity HflC (stomatin/prohibitin superfamily)